MGTRVGGSGGERSRIGHLALEEGRSKPSRRKRERERERVNSGGEK